jgi:hypothetical protein
MILSEQLVQARTEYHNLIVGLKARVYVDQNGERIEYTAANASRLQAYILDLERQLGSANRHPGPLRVYF